MGYYILLYVTVVILVTAFGLLLKEDLQARIDYCGEHPDSLKAPALMILLGWAWPVLFLVLIGVVTLGFIDTARESYHIVRGK